MKKEERNKKNCHSRRLLSGIYDACSCVRAQQTACVEDPRLQASGMTTNLKNPSHGEVAHFNAPSTWREGAVPEGRNPGVAGGRVRGIFKEEVLNKNDFRAPLRSGFTLIELLVVVLIIGILAAVALPQYQKAVIRSRLATIKPLVESMARAAELYTLTHDTYPASFADLELSIPQPMRTEQDGRGFHAYYPWGQCTVNKDKDQEFISCHDTTAYVYYTRYHKTNWGVSRACGGDHELSYQVCQQETGQKDPFFTDGARKRFAYSD